MIKPYNLLYVQKSGQDSEGLPPQPESPSSTVTSSQLSTSESATEQTKLGKLFVTLYCENAADESHVHTCIQYNIIILMYAQIH